MLIAAIVVIGVLLVLALVLAMARRRDTAEAVGVLSRETRKRDRSDEGIRPLDEEAPTLTGREVERMAIERSGGGTFRTAWGRWSRANRRPVRRPRQPRSCRAPSVPAPR